jgi:hypothetical protein
MNPTTPPAVTTAVVHEHGAQRVAPHRPVCVASAENVVAG